MEAGETMREPPYGTGLSSEWERKGDLRWGEACEGNDEPPQQGCSVLSLHSSTLQTDSTSLLLSPQLQAPDWFLSSPALSRRAHGNGTLWNSGLSLPSLPFEWERISAPGLSLQIYSSSVRSMTIKVIYISCV